MSDLADRFRREGLADAVVILVAKRIHPTTTAEEWGRHLGLQQHEVRAAIERLRQKHGLAPVALRALPGERHGNAGRKHPSLDDRRERNRMIVERRRAGEPIRAIAQDVGLTYSMVHKIVSKASA